MFGFSSLVHLVNGFPLYNLSFDKSNRSLYELTMYSLHRDSQLFENGTTQEMFAKTHSIIVLDLPSTQDITIVRMGTVE